MSEKKAAGSRVLSAGIPLLVRTIRRGRRQHGQPPSRSRSATLNEKFRLSRHFGHLSSVQSGENAYSNHLLLEDAQHLLQEEWVVQRILVHSARLWNPRNPLWARSRPSPDRDVLIVLCGGINWRTVSRRFQSVFTLFPSISS
jgi:hypothetical protein